jgi:hypothetical protein
MKRIFEIRQKLSEQEQKAALSLYFRADFNNSTTILTRIVSRFRIYIQTQKQVRLRNKNLVKLKCDSLKSDTNWPEQEPITMPIQLEWSDFNFERNWKLWDNSRKNGVQVVKIGQKIKDSTVFVYSLQCTQSCTKTALSLYFWADFNHSHAILTRIVRRTYE